MKKALIVIGVLIVLGMIYLALKTRIHMAFNGQSPEEFIPSSADKEETADIDRSKMLKIGASGQEVLQLQILINAGLDMSAFTLSKLSLDGRFGPKTESALISVYGLDQTNLIDTEKSARLLNYIS
jgi:hypothetical protein